MRKQLNSLERI